ncbi:MAG: DNA-binding protein [Eubacteriaceae bacterium]|nr:DNA-binding protein [Eubacteriaceae bacterium]
MEKKVGEQFLFDFYGELLTEKQKQILDYYYNEDYSLAEIAGVMSVTRQGIFDVIKRSKTMMEVYEEKLGLIEKFLRAQMLLEDIQKDLADLTKGIKDLKLKSQLNSVIEKLKKVSDEN